MSRACGFALVVWCAASLASAQAVVNQRWYGQYPGYSGYLGRRPAGELTVAELRKLGLSDQQILKVAEQRRDIEKKRQEIDKQLEAARAAAAAANAHVAALNAQIRTLTTEGVEKIYESVMTKPQLEAYHRLRYVSVYYGAETFIYIITGTESGVCGHLIRMNSVYHALHNVV